MGEINDFVGFNDGGPFSKKVVVPGAIGESGAVDNDDLLAATFTSINTEGCICFSALRHVL